ncbi:hypothetical protein GBAR_LOCUS20620, partial [Geodia barretti]
MATNAAIEDFDVARVTPSKKTLQLLRAQYHSQQQQHQRWVLQPGLVLGVPDVFSRRTLPVWQSRGGKIRTVGLKSWSHKPIGMPFQSSRKKSIHFLLMHNDEHTWYCTLPSHISSWSRLQLLQIIHSLELTELSFCLLLEQKYHLCIMHRFSNEPDLDEAVKKITENHGYISVVTSDKRTLASLDFILCSLLYHCSLYLMLF